MAFADYTFVKTKMSTGAETVMGMDDFVPEGLEFFIDEMCSEGYKVSARTMNGGHTWSISVTGTDGTVNQGLILSAFGDTLAEVNHKVQFLISLQPKGSPNWLSIPDVIKEGERAVKSMLRELMNK